MAHYAQVDGTNSVTRVLVITRDEIDTGAWGDPASWVKASYNTRGGVYYIPNTDQPDPDQSKAFRKNFPAPGDVWDPARDAFYEPSPFPSWVLDEFSCTWQAPVPYPQGEKNWVWDEQAGEWVPPSTN